MFSIEESIKYGWSKAKEHLEIVLFSTLLILAVGSLTRTPFLFGLFAVIFSVIIRIGYTKIFLRMSDGESPKFSEIFKEYKLFWRYLGTCILTLLTVIGGLILLILPGIFWAIRFSFASLILIDTNTTPMLAMKESYAITKGKFWKLVGFFIVLGLVNILGVLAFGVGLLVSVPVSTFAWVYVYRQLSKAKASLTQTPPSTPSPQTA
ncbi:MAG: hypothetical protein WC657_02985 [Candidatus Paceibacterota bacterium]|jgi:uncharacterized membrane protein